jgi:hypothetical protein
LKKKEKNHSPVAAVPQVEGLPRVSGEVTHGLVSLCDSQLKALVRPTAGMGKSGAVSIYSDEHAFSETQAVVILLKALIL